MSIYILRNIASSQSKGCALFLHIGTKVFVWRPKWAKNRDVAYIHAEIDTPFERLRIRFYGKRIVNSRRYKKFVLNMKPNQQPNNSYRDSWLKKTGCI